VVPLGGCACKRQKRIRRLSAAIALLVVPLPYARSNEIRFEELVGLIPPLSYSLPRWDNRYVIENTSISLRAVVARACSGVGGALRAPWVQSLLRSCLAARSFPPPPPAAWHPAVSASPVYTPEVPAARSDVSERRRITRRTRCCEWLSPRRLVRRGTGFWRMTLAAETTRSRILPGSSPLPQETNERASGTSRICETASALR
jgi:hypothetical protein